MTVRNAEFLNLDVGMGLIVQLTPKEAKVMIPKIKLLLEEKLEIAKVDLLKAHKARKVFEDSFSRLKMALDPLLSRLNL